MALTIAVTGLNATDNPGPGVPVIRALRAACPDCRIVGLAYDALDPGNYMSDIADSVYLMPYPSQGAEVMFDRLKHVHRAVPIDVIIPCLDAELAAYLRLQGPLEELGIHMFLPDQERLDLRSKARFHNLAEELDISVPRGFTITDPARLSRIADELSYPAVVKGQFYGAAVVHTAFEARAQFDRLAAKWGLPIVIQEFIPGTEYDVVALGDGSGDLIGAVPMRKMQLTDKGKAWGGVTIRDAELEQFTQTVIAKLKWRGPCELEVMRAHDTGTLYLIEINPRFPAWIYLAVGAGRNLPWATIQLALGHDVAPMEPAPAGIMFLRYSYDNILTMEQYSAMTTLGELHLAAPPVTGAASQTPSHAAQEL